MREASMGSPLQESTPRAVINEGRAGRQACGCGSLIARCTCPRRLIPRSLVVSREEAWTTPSYERMYSIPSCPDTDKAS